MLAHTMHAVSLVLAFALAATVSWAKPLYLADRDAVSPPITKPTAQTVWKAGETVTVTWDVAALNGAPPSNPLAKLILGTLTPDGQEDLMFETPLVSGFPILGGNVTLTVPSVPSGSNYIVCLFGTSDDISPAFTIVGTDASSSSSGATALPSSSSAPSSSGTSASSSSEDNLPPSTTPAAQTAAASTTPITAGSATAPAGPSPTSLTSDAKSASDSTVPSGDAAAAATSPAPTGTSGAQRGIAAHAHVWSLFCALLLGFTFL